MHTHRLENLFHPIIAGIFLFSIHILTLFIFYSFAFFSFLSICIFLFFQEMMMIVKHRLICLSPTIIWIRLMHKEKGKGQFSKTFLKFHADTSLQPVVVVVVVSFMEVHTLFLSIYLYWLNSALNSGIEMNKRELFPYSNRGSQLYVWMLWSGQQKEA